MPILRPPPRHPHALLRSLHRPISTSSLPRITQPSLWQSLIPKPFRRSTSPSGPRAPFWTRPWNPATVYIILSLLVGSQAIQLMNIRRYTTNLTRESEARLSALREVIERVHKGEDVDVEEILGKGRREDEEGWEKTMHEIDQEDRLFAPRRKRANAEETAKKSGSRETPENERPSTSNEATAESTNRPAQFV